MSSYVLTVNGGFYSCDELYHHGVKGMKWGVRKKQITDASADRRIGQTSTRRSANKMLYDAKNKAAEAKYYGGRAKVHDNIISRTLDKWDSKRLATAKARNKVDYDISELSDKYAIARQKARKDKNYKKSSEYKTARNTYVKSAVERMLLGDAGYIRIHTDMNKGKSKAAATGKEVALRILGLVE